MAISVRDKGYIPGLRQVDGKIVAAEGNDTGFLACAWFCLADHTITVWYQPFGYILIGENYGNNIDLTGWAGFIHDGHFKITGTSWAQTSPDGKSHFLIIDCGELPAYSLPARVMHSLSPNAQAALSPLEMLRMHLSEEEEDARDRQQYEDWANNSDAAWLKESR